MMKIFNHLLSGVMLITLNSCIYDEIKPPDICGVYTGYRTYKSFTGEVMTVEIQSIGKNGISGISTYSNDSSSYSCTFTGEWKDDKSSVNIYFNEESVISKVNVSDVTLWNYNADITDGKMKGKMSTILTKNYYSDFYLNLSEIIPEVPIDDPDDPLLPDEK